MKINFYTKNIFLICYPAGAGGKFISLCLALSDKFLHQHHEYAAKKIKEKWNEYKSYETSVRVFENKERLQKHHELGCIELGAYGMGTIHEQEAGSNCFWKELTNQTEYNFCLVGHSVRSDWPAYPNSKKIILSNFDWILEGRGKKLKEEWSIGKTGNNEFIFDMDTLKNENLFINEITNCCNFFKITIENKNLLNLLRLKFLDTYKIGFKST